MRNSSRTLPKAWWIFAAGVLTTTLLLNLCVIHNPYLWNDEVGQFFISLGIDRWDPPHTQPGEVSEALRLNNVHLFDPFGYTLLLRAWQKVGTAAPWLRVLPFLGYCGLLFSGYRFLRLAGVQPAIALLLIALISSSPLLYQNAGEIRPYIFEAWGAVFCGCVLLRYGRTTGLKYPLLAGLGMSAFLWMRYPVAIAAGITGFLLLVQVLITKPAGSAKRFALYVLPQAVSAIAIYLLCIRHQPIAAQMPHYGMHATLKYNPALLLHPWTVLYHTTVVAFLGITFFAGRRLRSLGLQTERWPLFVLLLFVVWHGLSVLGKISSDPDARWGIELNVISVLCGLVLLALLYQKLPSKWVPAALLLTGLFALYRPALQTYRWYAGNALYFPGEEVVKEMKQVAETYPGKIWSSELYAAEVRYLFEWGALRPIREAVDYPGHFVIFTKEKDSVVEKMPFGRPTLWYFPPRSLTESGRVKTQSAGKGLEVFKWLWRIN